MPPSAANFAAVTPARLRAVRSLAPTARNNGLGFFCAISRACQDSYIVI